ncbi:MAG TPA: ferritin family protein, partial [Thermosynergistes sp.]|nr:ferritin family protein [Thermosynergistes sp.]
MKEEILALQRNEITEYHIYSALARRTKGKNADVLQRIAEEEKRHAHQWSLYTKQKVSPDRAKILFYLLAATIFGITFATNLMEQGER